MTEPPPTPVVCEACGSAGDCRWCTNGYQSPTERVAWRRWRHRQRRVSATYDFLEDACTHVIGRLNEVLSDSSAAELALRGTALLQDWRNTDPVDGGRQPLTEALRDWHQKSVDYLKSR